MGHHWCLLTNGIAVNLDNIETVVPDPDVAGAYQFYPPRTQRGGRPIGKPTKRPTAYVEHEGYWRGVPENPHALIDYLATPPGYGAAVWRSGPGPASEASRPAGPPGPAREA